MKIARHQSAHISARLLRGRGVFFLAAGAPQTVVGPVLETAHQPLNHSIAYSIHSKHSENLFSYSPPDRISMIKTQTPVL